MCTNRKALNLATKHLLFCPFLENISSYVMWPILCRLKALGSAKKKKKKKKENNNKKIKKKRFQINLLKEYIDRNRATVLLANTISPVSYQQCESACDKNNTIKFHPVSSKLQNSDILKNHNQKLSHLERKQQIPNMNIS